MSSNKLQRLDFMAGYQDLLSLSNGFWVTCPIYNDWMSTHCAEHCIPAPPLIPLIRHVRAELVFPSEATSVRIKSSKSTRFSCVTDKYRYDPGSNAYDRNQNKSATCCIAVRWVILMRMSRHGSSFCITGHFEGNPLATGGFPRQRVSEAGALIFFHCSPRRTVEQTVQLPKIWNVMTLMWCHCSEKPNFDGLVVPKVEFGPHRPCFPSNHAINTVRYRYNTG